MINVSKIYMPDKAKFMQYVEGIYTSGWLTNNGPLVQELEKELEKYLGVKNLLLVGNGTIGLQLAYLTLGIKGEAITTPFSFISTTSSLIAEHIRPVFADIDPLTLNLDPSKIEDAVTEKTSAIVPVHVFGTPCDIDAINAIASKHDLKVIYDAAHTFGVKYKGKSVLDYGDISMISFHATKFFHTIEGGAIIVKEDALYEKAKIIRNYGIDGPDSVAMPGINAKMNEFEAAMGLCNLSEIDNILLERKTMYEYYVKHLNGHVQFQKMNEYATQSYSYICIILKTEKEMKAVRSALNKYDIYPRQYFWPSLDTLDFVDEENIMDISRDIASRILVLPLHSGVQKQVCDVVIETLSGSNSIDD